MKIQINGKSTECSDNISILKLITELNIPRDGTAIAINGKIIPRDLFENHMICENDKLDIIRAVGGG